MISYHPFQAEGHVCPSCKRGPFLCTAEDGSCENSGTCDSCIQDNYMRELDRRGGYGQEDLPYDW